MCTNCEDLKIELINQNQTDELNEEIKYYADILDEENLKLIDKIQALVKNPIFINSGDDKCELVKAALRNFKQLLENSIEDYEGL